MLSLSPIEFIKMTGLSAGNTLTCVDKFVSTSAGISRAKLAVIIVLTLSLLQCHTYIVSDTY